MPPSSPKPVIPDGRYSEFEDDDEVSRYCLSCGEQIEKGDKIYVDPSLGYEDQEWVTVVSLWHSECWDAAEATLDKLEGNKMTKPGPGKYEVNESQELAEYLDEMCGVSAYNDMYGDAETTGWYALFLNITPGSDIVGDAKAHHYIVEEDNGGFFTYKEYPTEDDAKKEFDRIVVAVDLLSSVIS